MVGGQMQFHACFHESEVTVVNVGPSFAAAPSSGVDCTLDACPDSFSLAP